MQLVEFISRYPKILKHPNLCINHSFSLFRHELCHFVEREIEKCFLHNFGFKESFGEAFIGYDDAFDHFWQRETRVMLLEKLVPFEKEDDQVVFFTHQTLDLLYKKNKKKFSEEYRDYYKKLYHRNLWWDRFHERYIKL